MIKIFISNNIQIRDYPPIVLRMVKKTLTLPNPMYYKLLRMAKRDSSKRRAVYACPETFKYYTIDGDTIFIPRGMRVRLLAALDKKNLEYEVKEDVVSKIVSYNWRRNLELRDWQREAVKAVEGYQEATVIAGTGGGKTICMLEIAYRLGLTCTILTDRTAMVKQWKDELKKFYGVEASEIHGKKKEIGNITVATFQSLEKRTQLIVDLIDNTSVLIVDEMQSGVTPVRRKTLNRFKPKYIFGTTATPKREDKQDKAINFYLGNTVYEHHETMIEPVIQIINTGIKIEIDEYPAMIDEMVENESRNSLIAGVILHEFCEGKKILVLTKRISHAEFLYDKFKSCGRAFLVSSKNKYKDELLADFKSGKQDYRIIFGTTSLLSVGQDISSLDTLILACDMKAETLLVQSIGRVLRFFKTKESAKIIDFNDGDIYDFEKKKKVVLNPIFLSQFRHRMRIYKRKGWKIEFGLQINT